jgi:hypothetical protein
MTYWLYTDLMSDKNWTDKYVNLNFQYQNKLLIGLASYAHKSV